MADGTIASSDGGIKPIREGTIVSMNFWGFPKQIADKLKTGFPEFLDRTLRTNPLKEEYLLPVEIGRMLNENQISVRVLEASDKWYGVTYREDKQKVHDAFEQMKKEGKYPSELWK